MCLTTALQRRDLSRFAVQLSVSATMREYTFLTFLPLGCKEATVSHSAAAHDTFPKANKVSTSPFNWFRSGMAESLSVFASLVYIFACFHATFSDRFSYTICCCSFAINPALMMLCELARLS